MKLTFLLSSLELSGGVLVIIEYANRFVEEGYSVDLIIPGSSADSQMVQRLNSKINLVEVGIHKRPKMGIVYKVCLSFLLAMKVQASDFIISTHTPTTISTLFAKILRKRGMPLWLFLDYKRMFVGLQLENWLLSNALRWHRKAFTISVFCKQELPKHQRHKVDVIGLGLSDPDLFYPKLEKRDKDKISRRKLFYLGDSRPRKGLADFLEAAKIIDQATNSIELLVASKENLEITTDLPCKFFYRPDFPEIAALYRECDLFVYPSWFEGFGLPPLEAMACGAPVVVTDSFGVREYAIDGENCVVAPPKNPPALAGAMRMVLDDRELEARLRMNGPITAKKYSWKPAFNRFKNGLIELSQ